MDIDSVAAADILYVAVCSADCEHFSVRCKVV